MEHRKSDPPPLPDKPVRQRASSLVGGDGGESHPPKEDTENFDEIEVVQPILRFFSSAKPSKDTEESRKSYSLDARISAEVQSIARHRTTSVESIKPLPKFRWTMSRPSNRMEGDAYQKYPSLDVFLQELYAFKKKYKALSEKELKEEVGRLFEVLDPMDMHHRNQSAITIQRAVRNWMKEWKKKDPLWSAIHEVLETERSYVRSLNLVLSKFFEPLEEEKKLLSEKEMDVIFGNLKEVQTVNSILVLEELESRAKESKYPSVGIVLANATPSLNEAYTKYIVNCQASLDMLKKCKKRKPFIAWLKEVEQDPELHKLHLDDYLLDPIKRIPLYGLLLKAVIKYTPSESVDYPILLSALSKMEQVAENLNNEKRENEAMEKIMEIQSKLICEEELALPGRQLVREGALISIWGKAKYFHLFNDAILCSYENIVLEIISLKHASLVDLPDQVALKNRFQIEAGGKSYIFLCPTVQEKSSWLQDLRSSTIIHEQRLVEENFTVDKPEVVEAPQITQEGYLLKQSKGIRKVWKKRWIVIEGKALYIYKSKPSQESSTSVLPVCVQLKEYYVTKFPETMTKHKSFRFFLYNDSRPTFAFCCKDKEELDFWFEVLQANTLCKPIAPVIHPTAKPPAASEDVDDLISWVG